LASAVRVGFDLTNLCKATIIAAMKKISLIIALTLLSVTTAGRADAFNGPGNLGFVPFGFYQPYGIRYGNTVRTPPHFAVNPPVYYGPRYARPYGESPFASPPLLSAPASYQVQPAAQFVQPPRTIGHEICNPFVGEMSASDKPAASDVVSTTADAFVSVQSSGEAIGPIRTNPFATADGLAKDSTTANVAR